MKSDSKVNQSISDYIKNGSATAPTATATPAATATPTPAASTTPRTTR